MRCLPEAPVRYWFNIAQKLVTFLVMRCLPEAPWIGQLVEISSSSAALESRVPMSLLAVNNNNQDRNCLL
ncbi:hypothetical protein QE152_g22584 [Popillia japonica]|uniref:Uncharacterized protein n=1 Tax=Popillia japonica TaxID=7064 RepID=A0AAW1KI48_POPJA